MPAQLVALNDGPNILVDKPILLVGRHPECDIQIDSRKISRRHCCIAQVDDYLVVRDLDSTNGVRINGVRVVEGKLQSGDELTVGNHRYQVAWDDNPAPPRAQAALTPAASVRPVPAMAINDEDDELLESCDEPVALPDPGRILSRPVAPPRGAPATNLVRSDPHPSPEAADSILIPENLELLPNSGAFPSPTERKS